MNSYYVITLIVVVFHVNICSPQTTFLKDISLGSPSAGTGLVELSDGYLITGAVRLGTDFLQITKCDSEGNYVWHKVYGRKDWHLPSCIRELPDSNFIILANVYEDTIQSSYLSSSWLLKVNKQGDTLWTREYENRYWDLSVAPDGGFFLTGYAWFDSAKTSGGICNMRTDSLGNIIWQDTLKNYDFDWGVSAVSNPDTTFIILGHLVEYGMGGTVAASVHKLNKDGKMLWKKQYPYLYTYFQNQIIRDGSGYVFTAENYTAVIEKGDAFLVKINSIGDTIWTQHYGENNDSEDHAFSLITTSDGGYVFTGTVIGALPSRPWLLKTTTTGVFDFEHYYDIGIHSGGNDIISTSDGGICITGSANMGGGINNIVLIKTNAQGEVTGVEDTDPETFFEIYPNPVSSQFAVEYMTTHSASLEFVVTDLYGRAVTEPKVVNNSSGRITIDTRMLSSGIYLLSCASDGEMIKVEKFVVTR